MGGRPGTELMGGESPPRLPVDPAQAGRDAAQKRRLDEIMGAFTHGEDLSRFQTPDRMGPMPRPQRRPWWLTPSPEEERLFSALGMSGDQPLPPGGLPMPGAPQPAQDLPFPHYMEQQRVPAYAVGRSQQLNEALRGTETGAGPEQAMMANPASVPSGRAPTMRMPPQEVRGTPPSDQSRALNFARALGFEVGEGADEARVLAAFKRVTRGMSVAQLLSPRRLAKTQELFRQLLDETAPPPVSRGPAGGIPTM